MGNSWLGEPRLAKALPPLREANPAFRLFRGRSSEEQSARLSSERPPVRARSSPLRGGRVVAASIRGCDPRGTGSNPVGHPFPRGR